MSHASVAGASGARGSRAADKVGDEFACISSRTLSRSPGVTAIAACLARGTGQDDPAANNEIPSTPMDENFTIARSPASLRLL